MAVHPKKKLTESLRESRLMQQAREIIAQTPEVSSQKVAALKEAIQKGTYRINARQIANSIISHLFLNHRREK